MRHRSAIALSLAGVWATMTAYASDAPPKPAQQCGLKVEADLDVTSTPGGLIRVPVSINGTDAWMLLNTGSAFTFVSDAATKAFNLKRGPLPFGTGLSAGGKAVTEMVTIDSLRLGHLEFRSATVGLDSTRTSEPPPVELGRPVVGRLGFDLFHSADFELNLAAKKLLVFSTDHCRGKVVYWTQDFTAVPFGLDPLGALYFPLELDGKRVEAALSTGYPSSTIDSNVTRRVFGFDEKSPEVSRETPASGSEEASFRAMSLTASGLNIRNVPLQLFKGNPECGQQLRSTNKVAAVGYSQCTGVFPMKLGIDLLTKLRIYVASKERVIYLSRADAH
jgi:aspartyl protease